MIKLIKNVSKLNEQLKEDRVVKSKRIRESLNTKRPTRLKEHNSTFEVDEVEDKPIHLRQKNTTKDLTLKQIEEIVKTYDEPLSDDTINNIILDCVEEVGDNVEPFTTKWDALYEKYERLVYKVVKHLGCGLDFNIVEESKEKSKRTASRVEKINKLIDDIYEERKSSISKDGEYGVGNQTFKEFRNRGYLDSLKKMKQKELNKDLSLENLNTKRRRGNK